MVKNTKGGSGHKKYARKFAGSGPKTNNLRVSEDVGEVYAIVTKMLGNGMFHCHCIDRKVRLGHIRGKFTFRGGKRDNMVQGGKWVLIGIREWDKSSENSSITKQNEKMQQCDLLEVYSDTDKQRLKDTIVNNWHVLESNDVSKITTGTSSIEEDVVFSTNNDIERQLIIQEMKSHTSEKIKLQLEKTNDKKEEEEEEEINFDDI
jgi:initiation factor 1A